MLIKIFTEIEGFFFPLTRHLGSSEQCFKLILMSIYWAIYEKEPIPIGGITFKLLLFLSNRMTFSHYKTKCIENILFHRCATHTISDWLVKKSHFFKRNRNNNFRVQAGFGIPYTLCSSIHNIFAL